MPSNGVQLLKCSLVTRDSGPYLFQLVECFFILRQVEKEIIFLFPTYSLYSTGERRRERGKERRKEKV